MVFTIFVKFRDETLTVDNKRFPNFGEQTTVLELKDMVRQRLLVDHDWIKNYSITLVKSTGKFLKSEMRTLSDYNLGNMCTCYFYCHLFNEQQEYGMITEQLQNGWPKDLLTLVKSCEYHEKRRKLLLSSEFNVDNRRIGSFWCQIMAREISSLLVPCVRLGMPVNVMYDGKSALGLALYLDEFSILKELLELGASPNLKFRFHEEKALITPLQSVPIGVHWRKFTETRGLEYLKLLLKHDASLSIGKALIASIDRGLHKTATLLVREGSNVEARDSRNKTPLLIAVERGDLKMTRLLHTVGGASPNSRNRMMQNCTPFMLAVSQNNVRIVKHFIRNPKRIRKEVEDLLYKICSFTQTIIDLIWTMIVAPRVDFSLTDNKNRTVFDKAACNFMQTLLCKSLDYF